MIELVKSIPPFVQAAQETRRTRAKFRKDGSAASQEIVKLLKKYPEVGLVGSGEEVVVVNHPNNNEKVISFSLQRDKNNLFEYKTKYYSHKILGILFPDNFPQTTAIGVFPDGTAQSVREKVFPEKPKGFFSLRNSIQKILFPTEENVFLEGEIKNTFQRIQDLLYSYYLPFDADIWIQNGMKTIDQKQMYVDLCFFDAELMQHATLNSLRALCNDSRLLEIRGKPLTRSELQLCESALIRIKVLAVANTIKFRMDEGASIFDSKIAALSKTQFNEYIGTVVEYFFAMDDLDQDTQSVLVEQAHILLGADPEIQSSQKYTHFFR